MRILIIKGRSQYEGTRTFSDLAAAAFRRAGHVVVLEDLVEVTNVTDWISRLIVGDRPDLIFTINIVGEYRSPAGLTFGQLLGAPHVVWHTDYIFSQTERLRATAPETSLLLVDPTQIDGVHDIFGGERHPGMAFFPHPAACEAAEDDPDETTYAARPIPLLWAGTFQRPTRPWQSAPATTRRIFETALAEALATEWAPPHAVFDRVLADSGLDLDDPSVMDTRTACRHIDTVVRTTRRFEFIKTLAKSGLPVVICGDDWSGQLYRFRNANWLGPQPMSKVVELMRQSRIVLSTNGNFGAGSHERPFTALLSGALPYTDTSRYYEQIFEDGRDIAMFRWTDLAAGFQRLAHLLDHPGEAFRMVQRGKAKVAAGHTWDARLPLILSAAGLTPA